MQWKLATIRTDRTKEAAAIVGERVYPLGCDAGSMIGARDLMAGQIKAIIAEGDGIALDEVELLAPWKPEAVYCAGANYVDHVIEMLGRPPPAKDESAPFFFMKPAAQTIVGPEAIVALPHDGVRLDWEAEIAVVIGRPARHVSESEAMDCVFGYTIVNDLSARDLMKRTDVSFVYDWIGQKCFPGALPTGPWITPAEDIPDPHSLTIRLWVNDELMQNSSSRQMHWSIPEQIAYLSRRVGLNPGDLVATGTPAGCGVRRGPEGTFLKAGDRVKLEIEGLGTLVHGIGPLESPK